MTRAAILLLTSQTSRLAGPSLALLLLAALWPAEAFGRFASAYALASLLGLLPATGLSAWLLDRSARRPGAARAMLRQAWSALALAAPLAGALALAVAAASPGFEAGLLLCLTAAMLLAGAADNGFAAFRAQRREGPVTAIALPANLALLTGAAVFASNGEIAVALGWLAIRAGQVAAIAIAAARVLPPASEPAASLRSALPFFGSQGAGVVYGQADTLLVHALVGEVAAGLYAVGVRLLQLASFAAQSLAQWFQPRLAASAVCSAEWVAEQRRLWLGLALIGGGGAIGFAFILPPALPLLLADTDASAAQLVQIAGLVLAARCFVAGQWIELTAREREVQRARDSWLLLALFLALAWPLTLHLGAAGAMAAHLLALGPIAALSGRSLARARRCSQADHGPG